MAQKQPISEFLKTHPQPTILHFQPTHVQQATTPEELKQWQQTVLDRVGLNVDVSSNTAIVWTFCGTEDPGGGVYGDDCASD